MYDGGLRFGLSEEIEALRDSVRRFSRERIAPRAAAIDQANEFPVELRREMGALGLLGITVEEE